MGSKYDGQTPYASEKQLAVVYSNSLYNKMHNIQKVYIREFAQYEPLERFPISSQFTLVAHFGRCK